MTAAAGSVSLLVALVAAAVLVANGVAVVAGAKGVAPTRLRSTSIVCLAATLAAFAVLEWALLTDDFSIRYVAEHHARSTGTLFSIATAWAALEGSLLLWALVLAGFTAAVARTEIRAGDEDRSAIVLAVMGAVAVFFLGALVTIADPFETLSTTPPDGPGPNPLLRNNALMAVHPPMLYVGYVGLTVPYAYVMADLILGRRDAGGVRAAQRWTLLSWTFLTTGIVLGAWWSYDVLGWGGYWAWDPVENASIMPWLAATAYLHSAVVHGRRGILRLWTVVLVVAAFALTILGTFLTRSGVIASVHAFSQSAIGPALIAFFALVVIGSLALVAWRAPELADRRRLGTVGNREGVFLLNNLLLSMLCIVVLLGTLYPIVHEAVTGEQLSVGRPYFDRLTAPLGFALIAAMVVGPMVAPGRARWRDVRERLSVPARVGLALAAAAVLGGLRSGWVIVVIVVAGAGFAATIREYGADLGRRRERAPAGALRRTLTARPGYWGGQLAHLGLLVAVVGIAASGQLAEREVVDIGTGDTVDVVGYRLTYLGAGQETEPGRTTTVVAFEASRSGRTRDLDARIERYDGRPQAIGVPAVWTSIRGEDLYVSVTSTEPGAVTVTAIRYPFIFLIWVGGLLCAIGGALGLVLRRLGTVRSGIAAVEAPSRELVS